jgi:hypothetical protein
VGLLHVGEASLPRVKERIAAQQDVDVELLEIGHLPEREAHRRLYAAFDAAARHHDAVVKVDADMELVEPRLLHAIAMLFQHHRGLDHILLGVDDWFSGERIHGLTAWRRGVRWTSGPPDLFTDLATNSTRTKFKLLDAGRPLVLHAADPTDDQALRYGLHRGLKAVASGRPNRIGRLAAFVDHAAAHPERGRLLAVASIDLALVDPGSGRLLLDSLRPGVDPTPEIERLTATLVSRSTAPTLADEVRARIVRSRSSDDLEESAAEADESPAPSGTRTSPAAFVRTLRARIDPRSRVPAQADLEREFLSLL